MEALQNNSSSHIFRSKLTQRMLSYRQRHKALTSHDQVRAKKLRKLILMFYFMQNWGEIYTSLFYVSLFNYLTIVADTDENPIHRPLRWHISIDSYTESQVKIFFRFKKVSHMPRRM